MGSDTHDAGTCATIFAPFAYFPEEIDTSLRPAEPAIALRQQPSTTDFLFKAVQQIVEASYIIQSVSVHYQIVPIR
jgi:hypothetical protein